MHNILVVSSTAIMTKLRFKDALHMGVALETENRIIVSPECTLFFRTVRNEQDAHNLAGLSFSAIIDAAGMETSLANYLRNLVRIPKLSTDPA